MTVVASRPAIIAEIATIIAATEIICDHDRDHDVVVVPASTVRFQKGGINRMPGALLKAQSQIFFFPPLDQIQP